MFEDRKTADGSVVQWNQADSLPRLSESPALYVRSEKEALTLLNDAMKREKLKLCKVGIQTMEKGWLKPILEKQAPTGKHGPLGSAALRLKLVAKKLNRPNQTLMTKRIRRTVKQRLDECAMSVSVA